MKGITGDTYNPLYGRAVDADKGHCNGAGKNSAPGDVGGCIFVGRGFKRNRAGCTCRLPELAYRLR